MTASIEGSEEVWSAILASILTHIAVFVPLLFLTGVSSIMFKQLSIVVIFSLVMSLFVAVTLVPVLCSKLLQAAAAASDSGAACSGRLYTISERQLERLDDGYRRLLHVGAAPPADGARRAAPRSSSLALLLLPLIDFELMPQTDEGEVTVDVELPVGTRIERTDAVMSRSRQMAEAGRAGGRPRSSRPAGGGGFMGGGGTHRGTLTIRLVPKDERERSNEQIAQDLRRQLSGLPGVIIRARASGGNNQMNRILSGGGDSRLRARDPRATTSSEASRLAQQAPRR